MKPHFTIVTISFNQAAFLARAIDSVLEQRDHGMTVEYIVVDPGSTDGSREILAAYGTRIDRLVLEPDNGPPDGLNKGFSVATGEILGFLNSDDELTPGALRLVYDRFQNADKPDLVVGSGFFIDAVGTRLRRIRPTKIRPLSYVFGACSIFQQGTFFRSAVYQKAGGFNSSNHTSWDGELFLDMVLTGAKTALVFENLAYFRLHSTSITATGRLTNIYRRDVARMFKAVVGRDWRKTDIVLTRILQVAQRAEAFALRGISYMRGKS